MSPQVIIGVGQPGAGKTTYLKELAEQLGAFYISPDDLREQILGDYRNASQNDEIWDQIYVRVDEALSQGRDVVVDGAGINPSYRRKDIKRYRPKAKYIAAYVFETPLEVSLARNAKRDKPVPEEGVRHFYDMLQKYPPKSSEGFDEIVIVTHAGE